MLTKKYECEHLGRWYINTTFYKRFLNKHKVFRKINYLLAKLRSLWLVHFVLTFLFLLKLVSESTNLYGNNAFPIFNRFESVLVLSIKKRYSSFLKNGGLFWKSLVPFFRRTYAPSVGLKMKPLWESVFLRRGKNQPKFCRKTAERSNRSLLVSISVFCFFLIFTTYFKNLDLGPDPEEHGLWKTRTLKNVTLRKKLENESKF